MLHWVPRLLGQRVVAGRNSGVMEKFDFCCLAVPGLFTVTKLRTINCRIPSLTIPSPQSLYWRPPANREAWGLWVTRLCVLLTSCGGVVGGGIPVQPEYYKWEDHMENYFTLHLIKPRISVLECLFYIIHNYYNQEHMSRGFNKIWSTQLVWVG